MSMLFTALEEDLELASEEEPGPDVAIRENVVRFDDNFLTKTVQKPYDLRP